MILPRIALPGGSIILIHLVIVISLINTITHCFQLCLIYLTVARRVLYRYPSASASPFALSHLFCASM